MGEVLREGGDFERQLRRRGVSETGACKQLAMALENYNNEEVKRTIQALRSVKVENDAWYPQPDPSLDLMRCIVDVDGGLRVSMMGTI